MSTAIDTAKVEHRTLHFNTINDVHAEIDRIAASDRAGTLRTTGNWSAGQTFGHLAAWINYAYEGYPTKPPWIIKLILKFQKNKFMRGPLPRGVRIPGSPGGTYGVEPLSTQEGYDRAVRALNRLKAAPPSGPNVIFGPLSHQEWMTMHQRHAELHLGYLHP